MKGIDLGKKEIFMNFIEGVLLRERIDSLKTNALEKILEKIGSDLARIHSRGVVHGDSTTSNIMFDGKLICWIDFGLSEFSNSVEEQATDVLLVKKSLSPSQFIFVKKGYLKESAKAKEVFKRLGEIEKRGRYVVRSMAR